MHETWTRTWTRTRVGCNGLYRTRTRVGRREALHTRDYRAPRESIVRACLPACLPALRPPLPATGPAAGLSRCPLPYRRRVLCARAYPLSPQAGPPLDSLPAAHHGGDMHANVYSHVCRQMCVRTCTQIRVKTCDGPAARSILVMAY